MRRFLAVTGGTALVLACGAGLLALGPQAPAPASAPPAAAPRAVSRVDAARAAVDARPQDAAAWSELGLARLDQARLTLDASQLADAQRALGRSLELRPELNYEAVTGSGMLANARHEFASARELGRRSTTMAPDRAAGYAVLADAEIQLGNYPEATEATQRLLDLAPTVAAYTRAAYDLETHGRVEEAEIALQRALETARTPADTAFCEHRLGDLARDGGGVEAAQDHYRRALAALPEDHFATVGLARVAAALGRTDEAIGLYTAVVDRVPQPQFLLEMAELQLVTGHRADAERQFAALGAEVRLAQSGGGPVDLYLARYLADHGDPALAVQLLRAEWEKRQSVLVADELGWALLRAGHAEEALEYARAAAGTGWRNAVFSYHRGAIEHALHLPEAAEHLREALRIDPHFSPYHAVRANDLLEEGN